MNSSLPRAPWPRSRGRPAGLTTDPWGQKPALPADGVVGASHRVHACVALGMTMPFPASHVHAAGISTGRSAGIEPFKNRREDEAWASSSARRHEAALRGHSRLVDPPAPPPQGWSGCFPGRDEKPITSGGVRRGGGSASLKGWAKRGFCTARMRPHRDRLQHAGASTFRWRAHQRESGRSSTSLSTIA